MLEGDYIMPMPFNFPILYNPSGCSPLSGSLNKRLSGFGASHLRPNPRYALTSDTRRPLAEMLLEVMEND